MRYGQRYCGFAAACAVSCAGVSLGLDTGDIALFVNSENSLDVGLAAGGDEIRSHRVFGSVLDPDLHRTTDPGIDSGVGALQANIDVGFTIRKALREWGDGGFSSVADERLNIRFGPPGNTLTSRDTPVVDEPVVGFGLGVNGNGEFHHHYVMTLGSPADDGVYLLELELWSDPAVYGASEPLWIVFEQDAEPCVSRIARQFVREQIAMSDAGSECLADHDESGGVDFFDLLSFLDDWFSLGVCADIDGSGQVDFFDLLAFLDRWFAGCGDAM